MFVLPQRRHRLRQYRQSRSTIDPPNKCFFSIGRRRCRNKIRQVCSPQTCPTERLEVDDRTGSGSLTQRLNSLIRPCWNRLDRRKSWLPFGTIVRRRSAIFSRSWKAPPKSQQHQIERRTPRLLNRRLLLKLKVRIGTKDGESSSDEDDQPLSELLPSKGNDDALSSRIVNATQLVSTDSDPEEDIPLQESAPTRSSATPSAICLPDLLAALRPQVAVQPVPAQDASSIFRGSRSPDQVLCAARQCRTRSHASARATVPLIRRSRRCQRARPYRHILREANRTFWSKGRPTSKQAARFPSTRSRERYYKQRVRLRPLTELKMWLV